MVAAAIVGDPDHDRCAEFFQSTDEPLVIPQVVLAEAAYLVGRLAGAAAESRLIREIADDGLELTCLDAVDQFRVAELVDAYIDLGLGTVDAAVIATAERTGSVKVATIDHRDFSVVRPRHATHFELVP